MICVSVCACARARARVRRVVELHPAYIGDATLAIHQRLAALWTPAAPEPPPIFLAGLRAEYEGAVYGVQLQGRVRFMAHCVTMWSCFSLAYYCMDLVVIVDRTEWNAWKQAVAHLLLLLPHVLLALVVSPALLKYHRRDITIQTEILTWLRFPYVFESGHA
jgi:hypothetical protein